MSSKATGKKKDLLGTIASVVVAMGAVFVILQAILPTGLTPSIATLTLGLILTGALVRANLLSLQTAGLTWAGTSIILVIVHLVISQPATMGGYVIDANGKPIAGQALVLTDSSGVDHRVITDIAGRFEIRDIPEGRYTLINADTRTLLLTGEVSPGWQRFVSPKVEVGSIPISAASLPNQPAISTATQLPSYTPPAAYTLTWMPTFTWTPTFTFIPSDTPSIASTHTLRTTNTPVSPATTDSPVTVEIRAWLAWQNTHIDVELGTELAIRVVKGQWTPWPDWRRYGGDGDSSYICARNSSDPNSCAEPMPGVHIGALIGKIDDEEFLVGEELIIMAEATGTLFLRINDGDGGLFDNKGTLTVEIRLRR